MRRGRPAGAQGAIISGRINWHEAPRKTALNKRSTIERTGLRAGQSVASREERYRDGEKP
jgi:hypothetical protein